MEHITENSFHGIWNYYLSLENDLATTSQYIEPAGQEDTHSFEFSKLIILSCTEAESVMKAICYEITNEEKGNIGEYKEIILTKFPKIITARVTVSRLGQDIIPFAGWDSGHLLWWDAYTDVKHKRGTEFDKASYKNAVYALSALYILILYLARMNNIDFSSAESTYIFSDYSRKVLACAPSKQLPDFVGTEKNSHTLELFSAK